MIYALCWLVVVALLALWSLAAWALQVMAVWAVSHGGALSDAASGVQRTALPDWLAPWVPPEFMQAMADGWAALGPLVDQLLQAAPALAGGVTAVAWAVWALGAVVLLLLGAGLHLLIALWRRRVDGARGWPSAPAAPPAHLPAQGRRLCP